MTMGTELGADKVLCRLQTQAESQSLDNASSWPRQILSSRRANAVTLWVSTRVRQPDTDTETGIRPVAVQSPATGRVLVIGNERGSRVVASTTSLPQSC